MSLMLLFRARPGIHRGYEIPIHKGDLKLTKKAKKAVRDIKQIALNKANSKLLNDDLAKFVKFSQQQKTNENKEILAFLLGQLALRIEQMYLEEALLLIELDDD